MAGSAATPARLTPVRILSRYFVARFLGLFSLVLAAAFLILATVELVLNLDELPGLSPASSSSSPSPSPSPPSSPPSLSADAAASSSSDPLRPADGGVPDDALERAAAGPSTSPLLRTMRYVGLRLTTYYLADLLPVASFVAVFLVYAISGRALEVLAVQAGGIRPFRIVGPVLATALILSFANALLHETVILNAERIWSTIGAEGPRSVDLRREGFWVHRGPVIVSAGAAEPEGGTVRDVEVYERSRTGAVVRVIRAPRARVSAQGRWHLEDAKVWRFDPRTPGADPVHEQGVAIDLDLAALAAAAARNADPAKLPIRDLARYLATAPTESPTELRRLRARFHERLASPWLVLVFAWLAVPFALRIDGRGRMSGPALAATVTLALYMVTQSAGETLARQELLPAGFAPWLTMGLWSALAAIGYARIGR